MIELAKKEIYRIGIGINVTGDKESKAKLTAVERIAENTKKKMKALDKIKASPSVKITDNASSKIDRIRSKSESLNRTVTTKLKATDQASGVINKAQNKINSWLKIGAKKVISIGLAGSVALGGLGVGSAMKTFTGFESAMSTVQATSQSTKEDLVKLTDKAKEMGAKSVFSATESAEALNYMAMA